MLIADCRVLLQQDLQFTIHPWDAYQRYQHKINPQQTGVITLEIALNDPRSVGSVTLESADPLAPPRVDMRILEDPTDMEA